MRVRTDSARRLGSLLLAAGLCLPLLGCRGEAPEPTTRRIIILTNAVSPFWDAADVGAQNAARDFNVADAGLRVVFDKNTKGTEGQIAKLKEFAGANDIAGVAISVTDPKNAALTAAMRKLQKSGVKVITLDSDVDRETSRDARFAYIGTDNVVGGRELGRCASGLVPDGGKYAAFVGYKGQANAIERITGFQQGAGSRFEQAAYLGDEVDELVARKNVRDALNNHPDLRVLVGIWSYNTPAIVSVVDQLNVRDKVTVVGFDAEPQAIEHMARGKVDAMVVQNPYDMGYQSVRLLKALLEEDDATVHEMFPDIDSGKPTRDVYNTGLKVVVPDQDSPLKKDMFDPTTEFLPLSEFQAWLRKYGLTGS